MISTQIQESMGPLGSECNMRLLCSEELSAVSGGQRDAYYDIGHSIGQAYYYARLKTADFYEWLLD
jgi:hypothetical protein